MRGLPTAELSRRALLRRLCVAPALSMAGCAAVRFVRATDIRIVDVDHAYRRYTYRAPYQFGGRSVDRVTILNVNCRVRTGEGREAWGFGSMTLGNAWAFPAASQDAGLGAMKALAAEMRRMHRGLRCEPGIQSICSACSSRRISAPPRRSSRARGLPAPIPKLCTLVVASAFDAAMHDAYGKAFGVSSYETYGPTFMRRDLSRDLGAAFTGEYLDRYVPATPRPRTPVFHSVGASDPLEPVDVRGGSTTGCRTRWRNGLRATASSRSRSSSMAAICEPTSSASCASIAS